jgi:hypothetical protein
VEETDRSELDSIRREWPASEVDHGNNLAAGRSGRQVYDTNDDHRSMMQAGVLMCPGLRHELCGHRILVGSDLRDTVHSVLFDSVTVPSGSKTLTDQASQQIRFVIPRSRKTRVKPRSRKTRVKFSGSVVPVGSFRVIIMAASHFADRRWPEVYGELAHGQPWVSAHSAAAAHRGGSAA